MTDAWAPQVNGVVITLDNTIRELKRRGHAVLVISPDLFKTVSCPGILKFNSHYFRSLKSNPYGIIFCLKHCTSPLRVHWD